MTDGSLTALGTYLEGARSGTTLSAKTAARSVNKSETWWWAVVKGTRRPKLRDVVAMALVVHADPATALAEAGMLDTVNQAQIAELVAEIEAPSKPAAMTSALAADLAMVRALPLPADARREIGLLLVEAHAELANTPQKENSR